MGGVRAVPQLPTPVRPQPGAVHAAGTRSVPETRGWGVYEQDPNYQPQFDPNPVQFMQQEQGQYMGGVSRGGMCRGGGVYELDPNYQPQFDPNLAQFMQQEQGQYMGGVSRGGMCRGGGCTSWTPTTSPSSTPTWRSSCSKNKVSTTQTWVGCVGVGDNIYFKGMYSIGWFCGCKFDPNSQFVPNLVQFMQQEQGQYQTNMGGVCRGGVCRGGG